MAFPIEAPSAPSRRGLSCDHVREPANSSLIVIFNRDPHPLPCRIAATFGGNQPAYRSTRWIAPTRPDLQHYAGTSVTRRLLDGTPGGTIVAGGHPSGGCPVIAFYGKAS